MIRLVLIALLWPVMAFAQVSAPSLRPDGVTITSTGGKLSVTGVPVSALPAATSSTLGGVMPDGVTLNVGNAGVMSASTTTPDQLAAVGALSGTEDVLIRQGGQSVLRLPISTLASYLVSTVVPPAIAVTPPAGVLSGGAATITGTYVGSVSSALDYSLNGGQSWTAASGPTVGSGAFSFSIAGLTAGSYALAVRDHGNTATFALASQPLVVAAAAQITLNQPANVLAPQAITLSGSTIGGSGAIQYQMDGGAWATLVSSPASGFYSASIGTQAVGNHIFATRFASGSPASTSSGYVTVAAMPSLTVATPANVATQTAVTIAGTYANGTPAGLNYSLNGGTTYAAVSPTIAGGNYSFNIGGLPDSYYLVTAASQTYAGATATTGAFAVGNAVYVTHASSAVGGASVTISGTGVPNQSNVSLQIAIAGGITTRSNGVYCCTAAATYTGSFVAPARPGAYTITWSGYVSGVTVATWTSSLATSMPASLVLTPEATASTSSPSRAQALVLQGEWGGGSLVAGTGTIQYQWTSVDGTTTWRSDATVTVTADSGGQSGLWTMSIPAPTYLTTGFQTFHCRPSGTTSSFNYPGGGVTFTS